MGLNNKDAFKLTGFSKEKELFFSMIKGINMILLLITRFKKEQFSGNIS